jgi:hypothetical protein
MIDETLLDLQLGADNFWRRIADDDSILSDNGRSQGCQGHKAK